MKSSKTITNTNVKEALLSMAFVSGKLESLCDYLLVLRTHVDVKDGTEVAYATAKLDAIRHLDQNYTNMPSKLFSDMAEHITQEYLTLHCLWGRTYKV